MEEIIKNITTTSEMSQSIAASSNEQSIGINEINKAMHQLNQVTSINSNIAQNSTKTAQELKIESEKINEIVLELNNIVFG